MEKSILPRDYPVFLTVLRRARRDAGLTKTELAERIDKPQSFVSKVERGELRLDIVQIRTVCHAVGTELPTLVTTFETALKRARKSQKRA